MTNIQCLFLLLVFLLIIGCNQNRTNMGLNEETLLPYRKVVQINDSIYLSLVTYMDENEGYMYMNDFKNNRIVCIDSVYNFVRFFGAPGHGPSELNFPNGTQIANNNLYVIDEGHKRINTYSLDGGYIGNISGLMPYLGRFIIQDSIYFGTSLDSKDGLPIFKAHTNGQVLKYFGTNQRILDELNQDAPKTYYLEKYNNQIIAICENDPVIERYSMNGQLIDSFDYSTLDNIESYINNSTIEQKKELKETGLRGIYSFCMNSYISNDKLFLLIAGYNNLSKKNTCNQILVFDVNEKRMNPTNLYKLANDNGNDAWYSSFCILNNRIVAYDALTYELHEFIIDL